MLPYIKKLLGEFQSDLLKELESELDPLEDIYELIGKAIVDDPPITIREGGMIREGYDEEADRCAMQRQRVRPGLVNWKTGKKKRPALRI
mgnify:CR=1 FL=1